ncbi:MAG: exosortase/archaeosortase family protein [Phycisphaerales bacterium]
MSQDARVWSRWTLVQAIAAVAVAVLACAPAWSDIYRTATTDPDNGYIVLVPAMAGWLALCRRRRLRSAGRRGQWLGPVIALIAGTVYLLGGTFGHALALHLGAIGVLIGAIWSVVGRSVMLRMTPAVVALLFLAPVPMSWMLPATNVLGAVTLAVTVGVLETLGMAASASGGVLLIGASGAVIGDDSGIRMMAAVGLVTYAFAFGMPLRQGVRIGLVLASPLIALLANIVRLVPYAFLADAWPGSVGVTAQVSGWLTLGLAFGMLYLSMRLLRYAQIPARRYALAYQ